jgi:hypothetical protein
MAAEQQVHRLDHHAHVGGTLALHDVELLDRQDRVQPGQFAPALEAGLGPIAVGAPDVDGPEFPKDEQHLVEMVGRRVVGVDEQGDVLVDGKVVSIIHQANTPIRRSGCIGCGTKCAIGRL